MLSLEIEALQDQALISILRQLRDGYPNPPQAFPQLEHSY